MNKYTERNKKYNYKNIVLSESTYKLLESLKDHPRQSFNEIVEVAAKALQEAKEANK